MSQITSRKEIINQSDEHIFNFISDFTNFSQLMPPQAKDLKITRDTCSFTLEGLPTINLRITERLAYNTIIMTAEDGKIPFSLKCQLNRVSNESCEAQFIFDAEFNMMMKMMVEKPLTNFLNLLVEKLKDIKA